MTGERGLIPHWLRNFFGRGAGRDKERGILLLVMRGRDPRIHEDGRDTARPPMTERRASRTGLVQENQIISETSDLDVQGPFNHVDSVRRPDRVENARNP